MSTSGETTIRQYKESIRQLLNIEDFSSPLVGDLSDLEFTLAGTVKLLRKIRASGGRPKDAVLNDLRSLKIDLEDDIPMILDDLLPALKQLVAEADKR